MANVIQTQKMIPFITCEISLCQYVCELVLFVNVFDLDFGSKLILSNNQSRATLWVLETCLIVGHLPFVIILITASLSSNTYDKASWWEEAMFEGIISTLSKSLITLWDWLRLWVLQGVEPLTSLPVLYYSDSCFQELRRSEIKCGDTTQPQSCIQRNDFWFCWTVRNWSLFLAHPTYWNKCMTSQNAQCSTRSRFWVLKISRKIGVLKQSQPELFSSITHMTILFVFTRMMNIWSQST